MQHQGGETQTDTRARTDTRTFPHGKQPKPPGSPCTPIGKSKAPPKTPKPPAPELTGAPQAGLDLDVGVFLPHGARQLLVGGPEAAGFAAGGIEPKSCAPPLLFSPLPAPQPHIPPGAPRAPSSAAAAPQGPSAPPPMWRGPHQYSTMMWTRRSEPELETKPSPASVSVPAAAAPLPPPPLLMAALLPPLPGAAT